MQVLMQCLHENKGGFLFFIVPYVDDFLITSGSSVGLRGIKSALIEVFCMTDLGQLIQFIGLKLNQSDLEIMITYSKYIGVEFLKIFHMTNCKETPFPFLFGIGLEEGGSTPLVDSTLYRQLIGSLLQLTHFRIIYLML